METRNVTLSLPKDVLKRAKVIAAQRGTSMSRLLTDALHDVVAADDAYARARELHVELLQRPANLGTKGRARWSREDLHER